MAVCSRGRLDEHRNADNAPAKCRYTRRNAKGTRAINLTVKNSKKGAELAFLTIKRPKISSRFLPPSPVSAYGHGAHTDTTFSREHRRAGRGQKWVDEPRSDATGQAHSSAHRAGNPSGGAPPRDGGSCAHRSVHADGFASPHPQNTT